MGSNSITNPGELDVNQAIFLAGLPDDLADGRIMNVRYFGEKMMLDLKIKSADQPGDNRIAGGEICRCLDLMYRPLVFQFVGIHIGDRERRMLDRMRQLKYQAQYKSCYTGENNEPDHPIRKAQLVNGQYDKEERMNNLESPEDKMVGYRHFLKRHSAHLALKVFLIVQHKDPEDV